MSDKIDQRRTENAVSSRLNLSLEEYRAVVKHPLRALPPEVRPAALAVWTCNKHLKGFESALPIAAIFSVWIDRHGLLPEDASATDFAAAVTAALPEDAVLFGFSAGAVFSSRSSSIVGWPLAQSL